MVAVIIKCMQFDDISNDSIEVNHTVIYFSQTDTYERLVLK